MLIKNLIKTGLIQPGTWLGVSLPHRAQVHVRVRVCNIHSDQIWAHVPNQTQSIPVPDHVIQEVDGMHIQRFCAQADLNAQGEKLLPKPRRGRKPKLRP
jgi:hypothetical protein